MVTSACCARSKLTYAFAVTVALTAAAGCAPSRGHDHSSGGSGGSPGEGGGTQSAATSSGGGAGGEGGSDASGGSGGGADPCAKSAGDGWHCGSVLGSQADLLLECTGGRTAQSRACEKACEVNPPALPDECVGDDDPDRVKQWAHEVLIRAEFGGPEKVVRWTHSPTLSVMEGSDADRADLLELIPVLRPLITPLGIELQADGDPNADIKVWFTEEQNFGAIGAAHGFNVVPGNLGYFFYNCPDGCFQDFSLSEAYVLIAVDKLAGHQDGKMLRHFVFEEMTQVLGPKSDSALFPSSIFYSSEDGADGGCLYVGACRSWDLLSRDRKLVKLLYTYLAPGETSVAAAIDAHWSSL